MTVRKSAIKASFSKAAPTYDENCGLQREVASMLAGLAASRAPVPLSAPTGSILSTGCHLSALDIGCGTGALMDKLAEKLPGIRFTGSDVSLPMLLKASEKGASRLVAADCEALPFIDAEFDIAASSLAYQWAGDTLEAFKEAARVLRPGGLFAFSTLGPGTFSELKSVYSSIRGHDEAIRYKSREKLLKLMVEAGFEAVRAEEVSIVKVYAGLFDFIKTLKGIGAAPKGETGPGLSSGALLRKADRIYRERFPCPDGQGITATYNVILMIAIKP